MFSSYWLHVYCCALVCWGHKQKFEPQGFKYQWVRTQDVQWRPGKGKVIFFLHSHAQYLLSHTCFAVTIAWKKITEWGQCKQIYVSSVKKHTYLFSQIAAQ